jgi:hypothetical protein
MVRLPRISRPFGPLPRVSKSWVERASSSFSCRAAGDGEGQDLASHPPDGDRVLTRRHLFPKDLVIPGHLRIPVEDQKVAVLLADAV